MCFSAEASFTSAAIIAAIGAVTLSKANTTKIKPFAAIPLLFALQQALEGIVWITLNAGDTTSLGHTIGVYGYLFIESLIWPIWLPMSLYILERNHVRQKILLGGVIIGVLVATIAALSFIIMGRSALIVNHHITYQYLEDPLKIVGSPYLGYMEGGVSGAYFVAIIVSLFSSSVQRMWVLGLFIAIGWIVAQYFYTIAFGSVWCFFAAMASILSYYIVSGYNNTTKSV